MDSGLKEYHQALEALYARTGSSSSFGLERTLAFLEHLNNPHRTIATIHVAGTNGKGSVVSTLYALLRSKGLRVGRYTSPHLVDFRERIVVDDETLPPEWIVDFLRQWENTTQKIAATFFEITTAMAFDWFAKQEVDVAVIETGLGGRLDATNVITPMVSGITSISLDHQEYLGSTEAEIAREKAGILKPGVQTVIGPLSTDARVAIYRVASESKAAAIIEGVRLYRPSDVRVTSEGTTFNIENDGRTVELTTGLIGSAQAANTAVALSMLRVAGGEWCATLDEAVAVLPGVRLPGRFQRIDRWIFDVAHNPDGMLSVVETLAAVAPPGPLIAVVGILKDKDWREMLTILATAVERLVIVRAPSTPEERAWNPAEVLGFAQSRGLSAEIQADFAHAVLSSGETAGTTLVTGSFYTVGDALSVIGQGMPV